MPDPEPLSLVPSPAYRDGDPDTQYWTDPDRQVRYGPDLVRGADPDTFRFHRNGFAADARHCYVVGRRLAGADPATFRVLNHAYVADGAGVWTLGGRLPEVDVATFAVCDRGWAALPDGGRVPYGYGKDRARVYYYDFDGAPNHVRKADPATFASLGDGYFGRDVATVFHGRSALPRADVTRWRRLGPPHSLYSTDGTRVFHANRRLAGADPDTFAVVDTGDGFTQLAGDRARHWFGGAEIGPADFAQLARDTRQH